MRKKSLISVLFPKIRRAVLATTLMHPNRWWFLTDLARHIGVSPSSLQREMESLVEVGILLRRQEGKQVYFKPDSNCPILSELQGIMTKTLGLVDVLQNTLLPFSESIKVAFVYGSIARSEELSESDVDLMIIGQPKQMNNEPSENMRFVQAFVNRLRKVLPTVPVEFVDERFTSVMAHQAMIDGGLRKKRRQDKALVDEISATIILQGYLETHTGELACTRPKKNKL